MVLRFWPLCSSSPCHSSSGPVDEASIINALVPARTFHRLSIVPSIYLCTHGTFFVVVTPIYFDYPCCGNPLVLFSSTLGMIIHFILFFFCLPCFFLRLAFSCVKSFTF
ncbi:hypothetical protein BDA99DRAFT_497906 [Phascolomyces articulosus]|uniref:Uncharacterized protein n=1 Tax=Phascolomyces articulosus TaxID=60185 RepID=A0AAD5K8J2_9FUNG|nr:hypothetical protein BDA99DRAFT_497906 [Phascolomyces articulosus]